MNACLLRSSVANFVALSLFVCLFVPDFESFEKRKFEKKMVYKKKFQTQNLKNETMKKNV